MLCSHSQVTELKRRGLSTGRVYTSSLLSHRRESWEVKTTDFEDWGFFSSQGPWMDYSPWSNSESSFTRLLPLSPSAAAQAFGEAAVNWGAGRLSERREIRQREKLDGGLWWSRQQRAAQSEEQDRCTRSPGSPGLPGELRCISYIFFYLKKETERCVESLALHLNKGLLDEKAMNEMEGSWRRKREVSCNLFTSAGISAWTGRVSLSGW